MEQKTVSGQGVVCSIEMDLRKDQIDLCRYYYMKKRERGYIVESTCFIFL